MDHLDHFKKVDPIIYKLALEVGVKDLEVPKDYFASLTRKIVGQQLSVAVARTIYSRFQALFPEENITPTQLLKIKDDAIRAAGISRPKIGYLKLMAQDILAEKVVLEDLDDLSDKQVIDLLTQLKGFGQWSAEMFLMFDLGREDVFSAGDLGLLRAMERHYELKDPTEEKLIKIAHEWSPFRTYACRVLGKSLEPKNKS